MTVLRGFATRRNSVGGGFDYLLPKWTKKRTLRYFDSRAERFLAIWVIEIDFLVLTRSKPGERSTATTADVDLAFSAVLNAMRHTHRPLVTQISRRVGQIYYDAPKACSDAVLLHFEQSARHFLCEWAADIESMAFDFRDDAGREPAVGTPIVDRALRGTFNRVLRRRDTIRPEARTPPARPTWRALFRQVPVWAGAILAALGGAGGCWTLVQAQLQHAHHYTTLPIAGALLVIGVVIVMAGGGDGRGSSGR